MPTVWIPAALRKLTGGQEKIEVQNAKTVRQVITQLDEQFPGIQERLCDGDSLRSGIAVAVDTQVASKGLLQPVGDQSEVHFMPAIAGGQGGSGSHAGSDDAIRYSQFFTIEVQ